MTLTSLLPANKVVLEGVIKHHGSEAGRLLSEFLTLSQIPRPSSKEGAVRDWISGRFKDQKGYSVKSDDAGNLMVGRCGRGELASAPTVALQAHMDMVTSARDGVTFDFDTSPISVKIDSDGAFLRAEGTTLGADDGIGVAACLLMLTEDKEDTGPIECLFTAEEETTMGGAEYVGQDLLTAKSLLNLDSEEAGAICVGCAGGVEATVTLPLADPTAATGVTADVDVVGGFGGHSGCDIDKHRANAIQLMGRVLDRACSKSDLSVRLGKLQGGSGAVNTIPRHCRATVSVAAGKDTDLVALCKAVNAEVSDEYGVVEQTLEVKATIVSNSECTSFYGCEDTARAAALLNALPHGIIRMDPAVHGMVESSINLAIAELDSERGLFTHFFARSSRQSQCDLAMERLSAICRLSGAKMCEPYNGFPGWAPAPASTLMQCTKDAFVEYNKGKEPKVYCIHAGLETGLLMARYPGQLQCVSIGPTIQDAHTPDERLDLRTVPEFLAVMARTLQLFWKSK